MLGIKSGSGMCKTSALLTALSLWPPSWRLSFHLLFLGGDVKLLRRSLLYLETSMISDSTRKFGCSEPSLLAELLARLELQPGALD